MAASHSRASKTFRSLNEWGAAGKAAPPFFIVSPLVFRLLDHRPIPLLKTGSSLLVEGHFGFLFCDLHDIKTLDFIQVGVRAGNPGRPVAGLFGKMLLCPIPGEGPCRHIGGVELPQDKKLINELVSLERRRGKAGKDSVDHPPRGSDDRANAVAGLCYQGMKAEDLLFPYSWRSGVDYGDTQKSKIEGGVENG